MKLKYCIMILLLACFLCGSAFASDVNGTDLSSTQDSDSIISLEDESLELDNSNPDEISSYKEVEKIDTSEGDLLGSAENETSLSDGENIIYFDANVGYFGGDGSFDNPYGILVMPMHFQDNSILYFAEGEYLFYPVDYYSGSVVNCIFQDVTIRGANRENTLIDFTYSYYSSFILKGQSSISSLSLTNMYCGAEMLVIDDANIQSAILQGNFYIQNSDFINSAPLLDQLNLSYGAAIYSPLGASIQLKNCSFINNSAVFGGAINMNSGYLIIDNCSFINNTASNYGGAISTGNVTFVQITNSNFENNNALSDAGGAIYISNSNNFIMDNVNITGSNALFGSAVTLLSSNATISKSKFSKNQANYSGGAIFSMFGNVDITDCVFSENQATCGGALFLDTLTLCNVKSTFSDNVAVLGGDIYSFNNDATFDNSYSGHENDLYEDNKVNLTIYDEEDIPIFKYTPCDITDLPSSYNLNDKGWVSSLKNQIMDGNCWAFAAMAALESCILKASNRTYDFSEDNMKNIIASYSDYGWSMYKTNTGGNGQLAIAYLVNWFGPVLESDDTYGVDGVLSSLLKSVYHVQNVVYLKRDNFTDNDMIKYALLNYGAVATAMFYDDAYLNPKDNCSYCYDGEDVMCNHAVTIVGWDDNYSKNNFINPPQDNGAWIVKNSWGSDWGDGGYFYVSYYDCLFAFVTDYTCPYTFILNDTIKYDKNYQYDLGRNLFWGPYVVSNITYYNLFTIDGDESLAAVSTYFKSNYDYTLEISVNGIVNCTIRGVSNPGYYTIPLKEFINLSKGDTLKVSFTISDPDGENVAIPLSDLRWFNNANLFPEGKSFICLDEYDILEDLWIKYNSTACIKAFTLVDELKTNLNLSVDGSRIIAIVSDQHGMVLNKGNVTFKINNKTVIVPVKDNKAILEYDFSAYDSYDINALWTCEDYPGCANRTGFETVWDVGLDVKNITYGEDLIVNVTLADGKTLNNNITIQIGDEYTYSVNITQNNGLFTVPDTLNAKSWDISVIYNYCNGSQKITNASFTIKKADSRLDDMRSFNFDYAKSGSVEVDYEYASNVTAYVIGHDEARVVVGNHVIRISELNAGDYTLNVTTVVDGNHNNVSKTVDFTVNKIDSYLDDMESFSFDYGASGSVEVSYEYASNVTAYVIGHDEASVVVGNHVIRISELNASSYTLNVTTVVDGNHNKVSKTVEFSVNKFETILFISDSFGNEVSHVSYGEGKCIDLLSVSTYEVIVEDTGLPNAVPSSERLRNYIITFNGSGDNVILMENGTFYLKNLTVGTYELYVELNDTNRKGNGAFNITIGKGHTSLEIPEITIVYGKSGNVTANTLASGIMLGQAGMIFIGQPNENEAFIRIDGKIITVLEGINAGKYSFNFIINDTNWESESTSVFNVTVIKANSTLKDIDSSEFKFGDEGKVSVDIAYADALGVVAYVAGHSEAIVSINNNEITISNLATGNYILNVTTVVDANHNNVSKSVEFKAKGYLKPEISIPEITPGKTNSIPVMIGKGAQGTVSLIVDGVTISTNQLVNGLAIVDIPELSSGKHSIVISYSGDENHSSFKLDNLVDVVSLSKITGTDVKAYYNDGSQYVVRVLGDDGNPLKDCKVTFKVNGKTVAVKLTDVNGYATYKITQIHGKYDIEAAANGLKVKNTLKVNQVIKAKKVIKVKKSSKSKNIKITLKGAKAYKKKKLTIKLNGKKYKVKTNNKGVAKFKISKKILKRLKKGKTYKYIIKYQKDSLKRYLKIT